MTPPAVKICGVTRAEDARAAYEAGAAYIGTVFVPSTPRAIDAPRARSLMEGIPLPLVVVVCDLSAAQAAAAARASGASVIQLHGNEPPEMLDALREEGEWTLWKAVRIREAGALRPALERYAGRTDGILVEGWHPRLRGGAGAGFDWGAVAAVRDEIPEGVNFIAAGGLTPGNVAEAVDLLRPDTVDTSSGVERSAGEKDPALIRAFILAARTPGPAVP